MRHPVPNGPKWSQVNPECNSSAIQVQFQCNSIIYTTVVVVVGSSSCLTLSQVVPNDPQWIRSMPDPILSGRQWSQVNPKCNSSSIHVQFKCSWSAIQVQFHNTYHSCCCLWFIFVPHLIPNGPKWLQVNPRCNSSEIQVRFKCNSSAIQVQFHDIHPGRCFCWFIFMPHSIASGPKWSQVNPKSISSAIQVQFQCNSSAIR